MLLFSASLTKSIVKYHQHDKGTEQSAKVSGTHCAQQRVRRLSSTSIFLASEGNPLKRCLCSQRMPADQRLSVSALGADRSGLQSLCRLIGINEYCSSLWLNMAGSQYLYNRAKQKKIEEELNVREQQRVNRVFNNSTNSNFGCWNNLLTCFKQYI